ncbi:SpaA isopeptide-forming pilin-related protein [Bacillus subtilis]
MLTAFSAIRTALINEKNPELAPGFLLFRFAPGQYAFVETKAPAGYVLNTEKIEFEISDSSEGKPEATDAGIAIKAFQSSGERRKHVKYTYFYFTIKAADNN